jgi:hypothetical protein
MSVTTQQVEKLINELDAQGKLDARLKLLVEQMVSELRTSRYNFIAMKRHADFWKDQFLEGKV